MTQRSLQRLAALERKIPPPQKAPMGDAALADLLAARFEMLEAGGYITPEGELAPNCPPELRSLAALGALFSRGEPETPGTASDGDLS